MKKAQHEVAIVNIAVIKDIAAIDGLTENSTTLITKGVTTEANT
ncbi:hypothetical protein HMPREF3230_00748 [Gardnerella vaginalis]|uniref:Uncharacterized protein n=1 Tax=Gardnerella vaginalis TaxID=2702 RepID=A0A135Z664_GARVA|nr:hypothetical protein HMPREF3230_00748 [Gardnerella vaginalis]